MSRNGEGLAVRFRVHFRREYHVGAGHGRGTGVDAALFTEAADGAEAPAIRGGHGLLRQAVFDLLAAGPLRELQRCSASGAPEREGGPKHCTPSEGKPPCPVCRIFGSPASPSPWSFSTLRPLEAEPRTASGGPLARVVSRTAMDPATRRPREKTLFSHELGAPLDFVLEARRGPGATREEALDELALLVAAARAVPALGAGRRRGRGECAVGLLPLPAPSPSDAELEEDALLARFEAAWVAEGGRARSAAPSRPALAPAAAVPASVWAAPDGVDEWEELRLAVRLDEPVVAGTRPLTGNLLEAEPFLPGSIVLGALAEAVLRGGRAGEPEFLRAFVCGGVLFPDLLPAAEGDGVYRPTLPAPRDLHTCPLHPGPEPAGHGVWSLAPHRSPSPACPVCGEGRAAKPKRLEGWVFDPRGGFRTREGDAYEMETALREETKIAVDPRTGRVSGESLYHRQAIPAGMLFSGTLRARPGALEPLRREGLLEGEEGTAELRLGKRNARGYGRVRLHWTRVPSGEAHAARTRVVERVGALLDAGRPFPLVAVSRVVLRDRLGRSARSLTAEALGLEATGHAVAAVRPVGGFRGHVGLPRRQAVAVAPGSVLWLDPGGLDGGERAKLEARLVELTRSGAGERTEEGFGRFAVAPFPYAWTDAALPAEDGALEEHPVPPGLRLAHAPGDGDALGRDREARRFDRYSAAVRPLALAGDEWRAVARLLRARAGEPAGPLATALEEGGGDVAKALAAAHAQREVKTFLRDKRGSAGWAALRPLLEDAAAERLSAEERAFRTRVLADALADSVSPGKVAG